jgi:hypothetical protein
MNHVLKLRYVGYELRRAATAVVCQSWAGAAVHCTHADDVYQLLRLMQTTRAFDGKQASPAYLLQEVNIFHGEVSPG